MKTMIIALSLISISISTASFAQLDNLKVGKCPETLLAKKLPAKTFYHPVTLAKLTQKNVELMASVGCIPRGVAKMSDEQVKAVLKAEYDVKLAKLK